jgi:hypothetical protein
MSYGSGPHLPAEVSSGADTCLMAHCGSWASSIKKSLVDLSVELDMHVLNARAYVFNASDIRASWGCKTCRQATQSMPVSRVDRQLQCDYSAALALWTTQLAPLQCQATRQHGVTLLTECNVTGDKTSHAHIVKDIICHSYLLVPYYIGFYLSRGHLSGLGSHCNCPNVIGSLNPKSIQS